MAQKNSDPILEVSAEEAVKSVEDGMGNLSKGKQPEEIEVLARVKFGQDANPFEMKVGASPTIFFKGPKSHKEISEFVNYTARMHISDAFFTAKDKEVCIESASFTSLVTPGATFSLTYQLVSYCEAGIVDLSEKCIRFSPNSRIKFILPLFKKCSEIDDRVEQADCYCKSIKTRGFVDIASTHGLGSSSDTKPLLLEDRISVGTGSKLTLNNPSSSESVSDTFKSSDSSFTSVLVVFIMILLAILLWFRRRRSHLKL